MAKGGAYENTIIRKLTVVFKPLGIHPDDCYRTRNSGATKAQPGDIQLSPRFGKIFPVLIECKHYKNVKYQLGKPIDNQDKSFHLLKWWKQVNKEQRQAQKKFKKKGNIRKAVLIFRQNRCPDLIALKLEHYYSFGLSPDWFHYSWVMFTMWKKESVIMLPLDEFLPLVVDNIKALRIINRGIKK
jgi:hypothetical protein